MSATQACTDCGAPSSRERTTYQLPLCDKCNDVRWIIYGSVEEAVRHYIRGATQPVLLAARERMAREGITKITLLNAIERRLRKLAKEARS